ncbi:MAG: peptidase M23 [Leptospiraceae bacterium]|nr:MAG: peptidase M23 [Leptospiraceae bacterium]
MHLIRKFLTIFIFILNSIIIANEFSWPIDISKENHLITSTFGESRYDHFHAGIDISGDNLPIYPIQEGNILYLDFNSMHTHINRFPSGSGNQIWLDHNNGYWSGYFHLKKFFIPDKKFRISLNESFALTGNTGRSMGAHLHFFILQDYGRKIINPFQILSKEIDENPPIIEYLLFIIPDKENDHITIIVPEEENHIRLTQPRPIYLKVHDPGRIKNTKRMPYKIEYIFKNNKTLEQSSITFDYLENQEEGLKLNGKYKFNHIYHRNYLKLKTFDFTEGKNFITITAYDINQNKSTKKFILNIKKEY